MKKWFIGIGVILLCVVAAVVLFHIRGKVLLTRKIAELKAQGLPTSFAELEAYSKLPEGTANAADIYMKAFAAYRPLPDAEKQKILPVIGEQRDPNDNEPYPPERMAAAAEFIELNKEMFALLHEGGKVEDCYYPIDYSQGPSPIKDLLLNIKRACQSLGIAVIYYSQTNQSQKAYGVLNDQSRLGQSLSRSHCLFSHLIRIAILGLDVFSIQDIINRTTLDEVQLRQLQDTLQQVNQSTTIGPALVGEICVCLEYRKLNRNIRDVNELMFYAMSLAPQDPATLIGAYQRMIAIDTLPIEKQSAKVKEVCDAPFILFPSWMSLPAMKKTYSIHLRVRANMGCAITALAVERYRLKEKKLPETVDALVPGYLPGVYMDPFDGKPLRYKKTEPGYMIYTIGADGVDNGGQGWDKTTKTQDWVFRVYR